jgi:biopolymer transport protein ExbD
MNRTIEVCLVALAFTATITPAVAAQSGETEPLRKGISVQLPVTSNAVPVPDADESDSLIVAVTQSGTVYLGIDRMTSAAALTEKLKPALSGKKEKKIYIKADTRTMYINVANVLAALRMAGVEAPILLTAQRESPEPGTPVVPKGLEVLLTPPASVSERVTVEVLNSGQGRPTLKVNHEDAEWTALPSSLKQVVQNQKERAVLVKADGTLPFAHVVDVADVCRSMGATVVLVIREG